MNIGFFIHNRFVGHPRREVRMVFYQEMEYEKKVEHAIRLLQSIPDDSGAVEIS